MSCPACSTVIAPKAMIRYLVRLRRHFKDLNCFQTAVDKATLGNKSRLNGIILDAQIGYGGWLPPQARPV